MLTAGVPSVIHEVEDSLHVSLSASESTFNRLRRVDTLDKLSIKGSSQPVHVTGSRL